MADIKELTTDSFDAATAQTQDTPALVDFWAPWCGPCKSIAPILEELATEMDGKVQIYKVNVDENSEVAGKFNIRAIPTLLLFKDGKVADQIVGLANKDSIKSKIEAVA